MTNLYKIVDLISKDEGFSSRLYKDSKGFNTIGFGFNLDTSDMPVSVATLWMNIIVEEVYKDLAHYIQCWTSLNDSRKYVLVNMAYHMGIAGVLKFKNVLSALDKNDYQLAASEMKNSQWYREFTKRANRLVNIMISGEF